jgi:NTE family protein
MYGLVLEGGGAKGAYHIGAYKAIRELGIEIGGIAGTSIGALNGALLVQGDFDKLIEIWKNINASELFDIDEKAIEDLKKLKLNELDLSYLLNASKEIINNGGLDTSKIRTLLESYIDEDAVRSSEMDFGIVTVNLTDRKPMELLKEDIPYGRMIDYLLASANLPAFKQEEVDGKKFLDGGFYDNLPIGLLVKKGYIDFIAVRTMALGIVKKVKSKSINITYIQPVESLGGMFSTLDFNLDNTETFMSLGYYDAMKVFRKLKGYRYYCERFEGNFIEYMARFMTEKTDNVERIGNILGYDEIPVDRMLFEKILPRLENILDMKGNYDYEDIILRLVERVAERYPDIERFKIYKADEFIKEVIRSFKAKPIDYVKNVPAFIKHNRILSLAVKDSMIFEIFEEMFL